MECGIIFWVNALKVINLATMSTQASWKYVNLFKVLYGIYTHLWFKGCSVYNLFLYFLTWGLFLLDQVIFEGVPLVLLLLFFFFFDK